MLISRILTSFERWIDPFARKSDFRPPATALRFIWFYVGQAKGAFLAMLIVGGLVAVLEASLFWFTGRIVDMLDGAERAAGWSGLLAAHGAEFLTMVLVIALGRFVVVSLTALLEEQTIVPGFFSLVRWQSHAQVSRQSMSFFQNDFSGRIVAKVWAAGQATGDLMVALLQVAWFIIVYAVTTFSLVASLDIRLGLVIVVWFAAFGVLARFFVPRIRRHAKDTAEASSMLNGRLNDSYANMQTLKLFGREEENDRYVRDGFEQFYRSVVPFTRHLTGVRASLALLSGLMIALMAVLCVGLWLESEISTGAVAFTLGLVLRLNMLLGRLMTQFNSIMRNIGTIQNSADLISQPVGLSDRPGAGELRFSEPSVRFDNVTFNYGRGAGLIENLSLDIRPGEKLGIIGRSGAGKSTLVNLLLRFYDVEGGRVLVGGQDVRTSGRKACAAGSAW
jgi:ATP-binding cassette subfamily B multidrug efflux pump